MTRAKRATFYVPFRLERLNQSLQLKIRRASNPGPVSGNHAWTPVNQANYLIPYVWFALIWTLKSHFSKVSYI